LLAGIGVTVSILVMPGLAGAMLALGLGFVGWMLPRVYLARRTAKRLATIERQLVDLLTLVASSVRSGFSFVQSLDTAAERVGGPLEVEVRRVLADVRLGQALDDALRAWVERLPNRDLRLLVTATVVQRSAGGNLSEVLENLAQTMRERSELRQQVRALTAYPRLTARVVALYPLGITLMLTLMSPETYMRLWTEPLGWALLGAALFVNALAFTVMRSIVRVDY
jgi:tight adherence protein B